MAIENKKAYFVSKKDITEGDELLTTDDGELETTFEPDTYSPIILSEEPEREGYKLKYLVHDENAEDPRELSIYYHLGRMICFHKRYNLGDKHNYRTDEFEGWEELRALIEEAEGRILITLPLYLYDHNGITIRTTSSQFRMQDSAGWDWGTVGAIVALEEDVMKSFNVQEITDEIKEKTIRILQGEVEEYDHYLTGEVYGIVEEKYDENFEQIDHDSCWGFIGHKYAEEALKAGL